MCKDRREYYKKYYDKYRTMILDYYGNCCNECGLCDTTLSIDHVYNNGNNDRYNGKACGLGYYRKLWVQIELGNPDRFQLLCYKCHRRKHSKVALQIGIQNT